MNVMISLCDTKEARKMYHKKKNIIKWLRQFAFSLLLCRYSHKRNVIMRCNVINKSRRSEKMLCCFRMRFKSLDTLDISLLFFLLFYFLKCTFSSHFLLSKWILCDQNETTIYFECLTLESRIIEFESWLKKGTLSQRKKM